MRLRSLVLSLVVAFAVVVGDSAVSDRSLAYADARVVIGQPSGARRGIELNIRGNAYYGYSWFDGLYGYGRYYGDAALGPGFQMLFPVVQNGFIPSINNAFYVGFFTDFLFIPDVAFGYRDFLFSFAIGPVAQWRFFILDMFQGGGLSAFTNLGFGIWPWFLGNRFASSSVAIYGFPLFELGANLMFSKLFGLTLSFGYPSVKFGITLSF
ncbi:MAG: hypothetical protein JNJ46_34460 [Myxococcales bacterium]|nr:hypothetical protein [Myxococcales bacterium]